MWTGRTHVGEARANRKEHKVYAHWGGGGGTGEWGGKCARPLGPAPDGHADASPLEKRKERAHACLAWAAVLVFVFLRHFWASIPPMHGYSAPGLPPPVLSILP